MVGPAACTLRCWEYVPDDLPVYALEGAEIPKCVLPRVMAVIGDGDSPIQDALAHLSRLYKDNQDESDFSYGLRSLWELGIRNLWLLGLTGGREDHTLSNLSSVMYWAGRMRMRLFTPQSVMTPIISHYEDRLPVGTVLSLLPFPAAQGVRTCGLQYALEGEDLELGGKVSLSNVVLSCPFSIKLRSGKLFLVVPIL